MEKIKSFWEKNETPILKTFLYIGSTALLGFIAFYILATKTLAVHDNILDNHNEKLINHELRIVKNRENRELQFDKVSQKIDDLKDEFNAMEKRIIRELRK